MASHVSSSARGASPWLRRARNARSETTVPQGLGERRRRLLAGPAVMGVDIHHETAHPVLDGVDMPGDA